MTPFSVVCPACGTKLLVQSADRIGEVELCPSCRSMVLIEPPRGGSTPTPPTGPGGEIDEATEAGSLALSFDEGVTETVDVARVEATEADRSRGKRSRFLVDEAVPPPASDPGVRAPSRHDSPPGGYLHPPETAPDSVAGESLSGGPAPRRLQHVLILAAATVTGIGVAAILFVIVFVATRTRPEPIAQGPGDPPVVPAVTETEDDEPPAPEQRTGAEKVEGADDGDTAPPEIPVDDNDPDVAPAPAEGPGPTPPAVEPGPPTDPNVDDPAADPMPAETPESANDGVPTPPSDTDAPPIFGATDPAPPTPDPVPSEAASLAELLERIAPGASIDPFGSEDPAVAMAKREKAEDLAALRAVMAELINQGASDQVERPPLREVDVEERLADPILRVHATDLSIDEFLHQVGALSALPLQWDPDVRRWAKSRGAEKVTVRIDEPTTVGGLLDAGLNPLGLGVATREGFVEILIGAKPLEIRDATIPWDHIPIPAAMREEFAGRIQTWIDPIGWGEDPTGRTIAAAEEGLKIRQNETELFKIDLFIDRLRVAIGDDPIRGTAPSLLDVQPAHLRAAEILEKPASLVALRPVPLEQAFFDLSKSSGLTIVADWNSLLAAGWGPTSETTFSAAPATLRETLATSLRKLGVGYRTVDDETIQVLSAEALALGIEIEIYRLEEATIEGDATKFVEGLASEIDAALGEGFDAKQGLWVLPGDKVLVAALPRPAQVWLYRRLNPAAKTASR